MMPLSEFHRRTRAAWVEAIERVCGPTPPTSSKWTDYRDMRTVLKHFMGSNKNHAHLPTGGGLDLVDVDISDEDYCLELFVDEKWAIIFKPEELFVEYISEDPAESFIYLKGKTLKPVLHKDEQGSEEVVDLGGGEFVDRSHWDDQTYGYDDEGREQPLPADARVVTRILHGNIMLVCKGSLWNGSPKTYRGEHSRMTVEQIRSVIARSL